MPLPWVNHVLDAHELHQHGYIPDGSLDGIVMTNVLQHFGRPLDALKAMAVKLKEGGTVVMTEPYFSWFSSPLYHFVHHEPVDFSVSEPILNVSQGPLGASNQALPHLIFLKRKEWRDRLAQIYDIEVMEPWTGVSYFATGGISRKIPIPKRIYRAGFELDAHLAKAFPKCLASFFTLRLRVKTKC